METLDASPARELTVYILRKQVRGSLSAEVVRRLVFRHVPELKRCYAQAEATTPELDGQIEVQFDIEADGTVSAFRTQPSVFDGSGVPECITAAASKWTFPAPDGGGQVVVAMSFALRHAVVIETEEPVVKGAIDAAEVWQVVRASIADLQRCYQANDANISKLMGTVSAAFEITAEGNVASVEVVDTDADLAIVASCVASRLRSVRFPKPSDGQPVKVHQRWLASLSPYSTRAMP